MDKIKTAVVGVGATGTVLAAALLSRDPDTVLVAPRRDLRDKILERGLVVTGALSYQVPATRVVASIADLREMAPDAVYLCTKTSNLAQVVDELAGVQRPGMKVVSAHNGLGPEDFIAERLGVSLPPSRTAEAPLDACDVGILDEAIASAQHAWPDFSEATVEQLVRFYGTDYEDVLALTREQAELSEVLNADGEILAQAVFAVRSEGAIRLSDVLLRRTGLGTLGDPRDGTFERVADVVASEARWSDERCADELAAARAAVHVPASISPQFEEDASGEGLR